MNWIESETKPETNKVVLCYSNDYNGETPFLAFWNGVSWIDKDYDHYDDDGFSIIREDVTHWIEYEIPNCG